MRFFCNSFTPHHVNQLVYNSFTVHLTMDHAHVQLIYSSFATPSLPSASPCLAQSSSPACFCRATVGLKHKASAFGLALGAVHLRCRDAPASRDPAYVQYYPRPDASAVASEFQGKPLGLEGVLGRGVPPRREASARARSPLHGPRGRSRTRSGTTARSLRQGAQLLRA